MADVRLIDANALKVEMAIDLVLAIQTSEMSKYDMVRCVLDKIDEVSTIDTVKVVRCRECLFRGQWDLCPMCVRVYMLDEEAYLDCTEDDGFCHKGEKLDGGAT